MSKVSRDPYTILGISRQSSLSDIKKAYRTLVVKYHPDKHPDDDSAAEQFKEVLSAYGILGSPQEKEEYDRSSSRKSNQDDPLGSGFFNQDIFEYFFGPGDPDNVQKSWGVNRTHTKITPLERSDIKNES